MFTLALDTSTNRGEIALLNGRDLLSEKTWEREKSHSELITSLIAETLKESGIQISKLNRIAVGRGPGSFTGIRIAINAARTLAYALEIPVFAFDTTEILAAAVPNSKNLPLVTLVNAHKNLLYTSIFDAASDPSVGSTSGPTQNASRAWQKRLGPEAWTLDQLEADLPQESLCVGDGYLEFESVLTAGLKAKLKRDPTLPDYPQAAALGRLAQATQAQPLVWKDVQALYIRASEAEEKFRERQQNQSPKT